MFNISHIAACFTYTTLAGKSHTRQVKHRVNDTQVHVCYMTCFQAMSPQVVTNGCRTLVAFVNSVVYSVDVSLWQKLNNKSDKSMENP